MKDLREFMFSFYNKINILSPNLLKNKTILITGSNGLIGGNLLTFLDYFSEINNLQLKLIGVSRSKKALWLPDSKYINYIKLDLANKDTRADFPKFDYIIHAATYAQPKKILENREQTVALNVNSLFRILDEAENNKAHMLFISSSEIYGETDKVKPTNESYFGMVNTLSDRAIYAESKRLAESICYSYRNKVDIKIARLLLCYGPGVKSDDRRVYTEFIKQAQFTSQVIMMDEGRAKRTFCYISDAIEMILNIMLTGREFVYNVAGRDTITIESLAKKIAEINNAKFVEFAGGSSKISGTPSNSIISNNRYCNEFKKKKFINFGEGLKATSLWIKNIQKLK